MQLMQIRIIHCLKRGLGVLWYLRIAPDAGYAEVIIEFCGSMKSNSKAAAAQGRSVDEKVAMMG